ncbi:mitochondrial, NADH dehydrogenase [ubiquinone] 1 beta subcomplex subunit 2 [Lucilia cuprina]|nr:mitochondrial, NADH dehydrogenase [ubiquinone] 1 beta subcomplex subunit 2 [Lucilia cuprina]
MISRIQLLYKPILRNISARCGKKIDLQFRNSHVVSYRVAPPPHSKATQIGAELVGAAMWWWVLWHLWHEYEHITGEFPYPDAAKWTNKELGVPS